nr:hypothetical protein [uncultured Treponema sp.]
MDPDGRSELEESVAKEVGDTSTKKGVDINLFTVSSEKDFIDTKANGDNVYMRDVAKNARRYKALFYVSAHGNRNVVSSYGEDGKESKRYLSPEQLAKMIKANENYHGQPVVLWICETAKDPENQYNITDCFAKQLAEFLGEGAIVIASETTVAYKSGVVYMTKSNGQEVSYRTYSADPDKQYVFKGGAR